MIDLKSVAVYVYASENCLIVVDGEVSYCEVELFLDCLVVLAYEPFGIQSWKARNGARGGVGQRFSGVS